MIVSHRHRFVFTASVRGEFDRILDFYGDDGDVEQENNSYADADAYTDALAGFAKDSYSDTIAAIETAVRIAPGPPPAVSASANSRFMSQLRIRPVCPKSL